MSVETRSVNGSFMRISPELQSVPTSTLPVPIVMTSMAVMRRQYLVVATLPGDAGWVMSSVCAASASSRPVKRSPASA